MRDVTDLLNLLIQGFEHVGFTRRFLNYFPDDALRITVEAVCAGAAAGDHLEESFLVQLLPLLRERAVLDRLSQLLRTDRQITINIAGPLFAARKAAQLNQVMAFAILEAAKDAGRPVQRSSGHVTDVAPSDKRFQVSGLNLRGGPLTETFDHAVFPPKPFLLTAFRPARSSIRTPRRRVCPGSEF